MCRALAKRFMYTIRTHFEVDTIVIHWFGGTQDLDLLFTVF